MSTDSEIAALCPLCATVATGEELQALRETASDHNESRHDGERVARTVRPKRKHVEAFVNRVRRRYGSAAAEEVVENMADVGPWSEVSS